MNSSFWKSLIDLARAPTTDTENWLGNSEQSVRFLTQICEMNDDVFLYVSSTHFIVESVLAPRTAVDPPDHNDLAAALLLINDTWSIQRTYGGGKGERIHLEPPLSFPGCQTLVGGEKLVFRRSFDGVESYRPTIEISQKLLHTLGLYHMDERSAYCRLNRRGDFEDVITEMNDEHSDSWQNVCAITISRHDLAKYMVLTDTALVTKFDFTRFAPENFLNWDGVDEQVFQSRDLYYRSRVIPNHASYANGHLVLHTNLSMKDLVEEWNAERDTSTKKYSSFKIIDRKNKKLVETSCGPDHIVNYFTDSDLPWEISPAFFRPEVLLKYKADREKYTINDRSISCRGSWYLETYDINDANQVHTYIGYLAKLPFEEQQYWKLFNEWPKDDISKRAYQTDILGEFSTENDPLVELKEQVQRLDHHMPTWWSQRGEKLVGKVLYPATDSIEEWGNEILALDQLVIEGFRVKGLRHIIEYQGSEYEKEWRSLKLLEVLLSIAGHDENEAKKLVEPLRELHNLRILVKAHGDISGRQVAVSTARKSHGTLRKHFQDLVERVRESVKQIESSIPKT